MTHGRGSVAKDECVPSPAFPAIAILVFSLLLLPARADAELGGSMASVRADGARMGAQMTSEDRGKYARHALMRTNGGAVHELTNAAGQVFAVTWSGPGKPDLRSLLGSHFATFQAAGTGGGPAHALRRPPRVNQSDLQIQTEGHMGWFRGVAFIPSLAPPGFSTSDLSEEP
jgi:hypothetical protein